MSRSKKNKLTNNTSCESDLNIGKSFFGGEGLLPDSSVLLRNLKFGQSVHYDSTKQDWVVEQSLEDIIMDFRDRATEKRFENMEFAVDEKGRPDGIKNKQEMILTIASDIAESISEMVFEEVKQILEKDDWVDTKAMEMLKESMED